MTRNTYGSLNYWKGSPAAFSGVGEVAKHGWRDGSSLTCQYVPPPGPCLSVPYANYDTVQYSIDGGTTWGSMSLVAGDTWAASFVIASNTFHLITECGIVSALHQGISLQNLTTGSTAFTYDNVAYSSTYPARWTFHTIAGTPPIWTGVDVLIRTKCSGNTSGIQAVHPRNAATISISAPSSQKTGDSVFAVYFQNREVGTGALPTPTMVSSGYTLLHASSDKRINVWLKANALATDGVSLSGISAASEQHLYFCSVRTPPGAAVRISLFKDAQAAGTTLDAGSITFTGDDAMSWAFFSQYRDALGGVAIPAFSTPSGGWNISGQQSTVTDNGDGFFTKLASAVCTATSLTAGTRDCSIHSAVSVAWNSATFVIR